MEYLFIKYWLQNQFILIFVKIILNQFYPFVKEQISWLMNSPIGLKLNNELNHLYANISLSVLYASFVNYQKYF